MTFQICYDHSHFLKSFVRDRNISDELLENIQNGIEILFIDVFGCKLIYSGYTVKDKTILATDGQGNKFFIPILNVTDYRTADRLFQDEFNELFYCDEYYDEIINPYDGSRTVVNDMPTGPDDVFPW
jgi:hypothetical protein